MSKKYLNTTKLANKQFSRVPTCGKVEANPCIVDGGQDVQKTATVHLLYSPLFAFSFYDRCYFHVEHVG